MTLFSVVLFIHVLSALALFIAIAFEGAILARMRAAHDIAELRLSVSASRRLGALYGPAFLGILLGGVYLAAQLHIRAAWVPTALGATLLIGIVAGAVTGRRVSRLRKALGENHASVVSLAPVARSNALVIAYGFRAGLAVGIVFLMSATPGLVPSLLALAIGSIAGIVFALCLRRIPCVGYAWRSTQPQAEAKS
jgi:hypothetical protein